MDPGSGAQAARVRGTMLFVVVKLYDIRDRQSAAGSSARLYLNDELLSVLDYYSTRSVSVAARSTNLVTNGVVVGTIKLILRDNQSNRRHQRGLFLINRHRLVRKKTQSEWHDAIAIEFCYGEPFIVGGERSEPHIDEDERYSV